MTIEQVKEEAKKCFDMDLTDEQAQKWLEAHPSGELQDGELNNVAGGGCGTPTPQLRCPVCGKFHPALSYSEEGNPCSDCIKKELMRLHPLDPKLEDKIRDRLRNL